MKLVGLLLILFGFLYGIWLYFICPVPVTEPTSMFWCEMYHLWYNLYHHIGVVACMIVGQVLVASK